jgi:vanillate O-demethylase monooxygenase subunit
VYPERFPRNQWYVGAHSDEVGEALFGRWLLDEPVVFYRTASGQPVALADACPHRQYPLSASRRLGDTVECGYHGLVFDADGRCVRVPQQDHVPPRLGVRGYPLFERWGLVWIWMGDPALADEALIPDHSFLARAGWVTVHGTLYLKARAQLMNENLLDLSHLSYLHSTSIGTARVAEVPVETEWDDRSVRVRRIMKGIESPGFFQQAMRLHGQIDRTQMAEWFAPAFHVTHVSAKPAGDAGDERLCQHKVAHCITPETRTSTHYFWAFARDYHIHDAELTRFAQEAQQRIFVDDVAACEAIEARLAAYAPASPPEINIKVDAGPLQSRRIIERLVAAEQAVLASA